MIAADSTGMSAPASPYFTVDQVLALPDDGQRYELAYGELLVSPSPSLPHKLVAGRLIRAIADYCDRERVGQAFYSPADLTWGRDDVLLQPDVFVIGREDDGLMSWGSLRHIALVAEVLRAS